MKYTISTLMALSQVTDVVCNWTPNAQDCNLLRSDLSKRLTLWESCPNTTTVSSAVAQQTGKDGRSKSKSHCRPRTTRHTSSKTSLTRMDPGFARFLQEHSSPTHQRVTAAGRIVPMDPLYQVPGGGQMIPLVNPLNHPRPAETFDQSTIPGRAPENNATDYGGAHSAHDALAYGIANAPDAPHNALVPTGLLLAFNPAYPPQGYAFAYAPAPAGGSLAFNPAYALAPVPAPAPAASSWNPEAPPFVPRHHAIPPNVALNYNEHAERALQMWRIIGSGWGRVHPFWAMIWPPFVRPVWQESDYERFLLFITRLSEQLGIWPIPPDTLPQHYRLPGNMTLGYQPIKPVPFIFHGAWLRCPHEIGPDGTYWALLFALLRVSHDNDRPSQQVYDITLCRLVQLVRVPHDQYEIIICIHATEWLRYHRFVLGQLVESVDRRQAVLEGPDPRLTAERNFYVCKWLSVGEAIERLEEVLTVVYHGMHITVPEWRPVFEGVFEGILVGRMPNYAVPVGQDVGRAPEYAGPAYQNVGRVHEDVHDSPARDETSDYPSEAGDRQQGADDAVSGDDSTVRQKVSASMRAERGPPINPGSLINSDSQPVGEAGQDELEGSGGCGESSSQMVRLGMKPKWPFIPRSLSESKAFLAQLKAESSEGASRSLNKLVVRPTQITAAVSRSHAHADKGRLSDVETSLARMRV